MATILDNLSFPANEEFTKLLEANQHHFDALLKIVKESGERLEGNYMYIHNTFDLINDGTNKQMNLYALSRYKKNSEINVLEIGFNAGHSALLFLLSNKDLTLYCFDICTHSYTKPCFEYLQSVFPGRISLMEGSSLSTVPEFRMNNEIKFDIIHIDGSHEVRIANCDFFNTLPMSKKSGILIFDDIDLPPLRSIWDGFIKDGHINEVSNMLPCPSYKHAVAVYRN